MTLARQNPFARLEHELLQLGALNSIPHEEKGKSKINQFDSGFSLSNLFRNQELQVKIDLFQKHIEKLKRFHVKGINFQDLSGKTILHDLVVVAYEENNSSSLSNLNPLKIIFSQGGHLTIQDRNGQTPLHLLLEKMSQRKNSNCLYLYFGLVKQAFHITFDFSKLDNRGYSILHYLALIDEKYIDLFMSFYKSKKPERHANLNNVNPQGFSPFLFAIMNRKYRYAHWLLEQGVDPTLHGKNSCSPLQFVQRRIIHLQHLIKYKIQLENESKSETTHQSELSELLIMKKMIVSYQFTTAEEKNDRIVVLQRTLFWQKRIRQKKANAIDNTISPDDFKFEFRIIIASTFQKLKTLTFLQQKLFLNCLKYFIQQAILQNFPIIEAIDLFKSISQERNQLIAFLEPFANDQHPLVCLEMIKIYEEMLVRDNAQNLSTIDMILQNVISDKIIFYLKNLISSESEDLAYDAMVKLRKKYNISYLPNHKMNDHYLFTILYLTIIHKDADQTNWMLDNYPFDFSRSFFYSQKTVCWLKVVAYHFKDRSMLEKFIAAGLTINDDSGNSPALIAALETGDYSDVDVIRAVTFLLELGANPNSRNEQNKSIVQIIFSHPGLSSEIYTKLLELLVKFGAIFPNCELPSPIYFLHASDLDKQVEMSELAHDKWGGIDRIKTAIKEFLPQTGPQSLVVDYMGLTFFPSINLSELSSSQNSLIAEYKKLGKSK